MYIIAQLTDLDPKHVRRYWQSLVDADTLKYRLSDIPNPTEDDVLTMLNKFSHSSFYVQSVHTSLLVAEFMFENYAGHAAQVHFSMHPDNTTRLNLFLAKEATDMVLNKWTKNDGKDRYLDTIYGITPRANRAACIFIGKCGFKKVGTIPKALMYMGEVSDAYITCKERIDG